MSNKGQEQSLITRYKIGLANEKDRTETLLLIEDYINKLEDKDFPSITRCAVHARISEKALLAWEIRTAENSDIRILLDIIRDRAKATLIEKGLDKSFDSRMTSFLLETNHGMKKQPTELTQNNIFNVSPEIMAEALALSRSPKQKKSSSKE